MYPRRPHPLRRPSPSPSSPKPPRTRSWNAAYRLLALLVGTSMRCSRAPVSVVIAALLPMSSMRSFLATTLLHGQYLSRKHALWDALTFLLLVRAAFLLLVIAGILIGLPRN